VSEFIGPCPCPYLISWGVDGEPFGTTIYYRYKFDNEFAAMLPETTKSSLTQNEWSGHAKLYIQARDAAGNWSPTTFYPKFGLPLLAPTVTGKLIVSNTQPVFRWATTTGSAGDAIFQFKFGPNGTFLDTDPTTYSKTYTSPTTFEGVHTIHVRERRGSSWSSVMSFSTKVDNTPPPAPNISAFAEGSAPCPTASAKTSLCTVAGWSTKSGLGGAGIFRYRIGTSGTWSAESSKSTLLYTDVETANFTLFVSERDAAGNWSTAAQVTR
jgi:hypothetical protein